MRSRDFLPEWFLAFAGVCFVALLMFVFCWAGKAYGRDLGQWQNSDPAIREWYQTLMQPDAPASSCCGEADAYWCDEIHVRDGRTFCGITDDRPDEPLKHMHVPIGTQIEIPNHKLKWDRGNPTGHSIVFLSRNLYPYCFVQNGGS